MAEIKYSSLVHAVEENLALGGMCKCCLNKARWEIKIDSLAEKGALSTGDGTC